MDIEFLLERLEQYVFEECPKFLGNRMVNDGEIRSRLTQLKQAIPEEIQEAQRIIQQRDAILAQAQRDADDIRAAAHVEAQKLVAEHVLVKEARQKAQSIPRKAEHKAEGLRADADEYVFDTLSQLQAELTRSLKVVENGLQKLETDRERAIRQAAH